MAAPSLDEVLASPTSALLVGMGVANRAVAGALARRGHTVVAVDDNPSDELRADADALGITLGRATNSPILSPLQHSSSRPRSPGAARGVRHRRRRRCGGRVRV